MWNLSEKRVQIQDRSFPQDPLYVWFCMSMIIIFSFLNLLLFEKHLKEMLVVIPPCVVMRSIKQNTDNLHCPTFSLATGINLPLPAVNFCIWLHLLISPVIHSHLVSSRLNYYTVCLVTKFFLLYNLVNHPEWHHGLIIVFNINWSGHTIE